MRRERMVSLRATSEPLRSSAGWGSCAWEAMLQKSRVMRGLQGNTHGVTSLLRNLDYLAELGSALGLGVREVIEDVAEGTGEDTLDLGDLVAGLEEVAESRDDGETGSDGRLEVDETRTGSVLGGDDVLEEVVGGREALLIGSDDGETGRDGGGVELRDGKVGSAVDEDGVLLRLAGSRGEGLDELGGVGGGVGSGGVGGGGGERGGRRGKKGEEGLGVDGRGRGRDGEGVLRVGEGHDREELAQRRRGELVNDLEGRKQESANI